MFTELSVRAMRRKKIRPEFFGGIIFDSELRITAYVDKDFMRRLGYNEFPDLDYLSAPEVVHVEVTRRCPLNCKHCYVNAGFGEELSLKQFKELIDILADMNVFQIAFGGGEPFYRDDFLEIARYAYDCGIISNVTTNGVVINTDKLDIFGQINVSLDGADKETYLKVRGCDTFHKALNAIKMLVESYNVGINVVVTRQNFNQLHEIFKLAEELEVSEVMLIRVKPVGRCKNVYDDLKLTRDQLSRFDETVRSLLNYDVLLRIDCAFMPFLTPDDNVLIGMQGCDCGISSLAIKSDGRVTPCSFLNHSLGYYKDLREIWNDMDDFRKYEVDECRGCPKYHVCRGGCRVFAKKNLFGKDSECLY